MLLKISLCFLLLTGCVGWSKRDMALQGAFMTATALDWAQTMKITNRCEEANPFIGECGQNIAPSVWFPVTMFAEYVIMSELPSVSRGWILGLGTGIEAKTVYHNHLEGIDP